ncbi:MAG: PPC domain-containing protein [Candidatus Heimdallarchaeaceae archaeon]
MTTEDNSSSYYNFIVDSFDSLDPLEKDDSLNYARNIELNTTVGRRIFPVGEVDYCTFNLDKEYNIVIETSGTSGDTVLFLYDENLTLITVNDNSGVDSFSKIVLLLEPGNYIIRIVENGDDEVIVSYSITLTAYEIPEIHEFTTQLSLTVTVIVIISIVLLLKNDWKRKMKK